MSSLGLIALILGMLLLGQPLFVILGGITAYCYAFLGDGNVQGVIEDIYFAANKDLLLAIPLFILAGNLMTQGGIARRLIRIATSLTAPIPAGLAVAAVFSCAIFAAISGSSPVTLIAIGGIMYPALKNANYPKTLSVGVLSAGGTLGIIIPPSIPMIVYSIMAGGVSVTDLFIAGVGPGILLTTLLMIYCLFQGRELPRGQFNLGEVATALKEGIFALFMPVVILGGIYSGLFTATESAAIAVLYALAVEFLVHRELKVSKIPAVLSETAELLGTLFLILVFAVSLNKYMTYEEIPQKLVEYLASVIHSKFAFLIGVNFLLIIAGCFMDAISAILVLAPLLSPMAAHYGVSAVHFGIIMIVNLEIGYLTPPVGVNLFVASSVFKEKLVDVIRAVLPLIVVMLLGLAIITFVPELSTFLLKK